jgi:hypothetical protein
MLRPLLIARFAALGAMTFWVGGFTFYAGIVIPILHEFMAESEAGQITRQVTDALNLVGLVAVVVWSILLIMERKFVPRWASQLRLAAFGGAVLLLVGQGVVHQILDARLDAGSMRGFYPIHRVYVGGSTLQWGLNLALLYLSLVLWNARESENTS